MTSMFSLSKKDLLIELVNIDFLMNEHMVNKTHVSKLMIGKNNY